MRLTKGVDYAARGILYLAKQPEDTVVLTSEIADAEGLPESYLAKIFQDLAKEGIVYSHRGAKGGFSLARPACEITLRQIIEAVEGPIALSTCLAPQEGCEKRAVCAVHSILKTAQGQLLSVLEATTLAQLANSDRVLPGVASTE